MDIALTYNTDRHYADISIENGDLKINHDLESSVIISAFSNRLAELGDTYRGDDRRGWWADTYSDIQGSLVGSKLWQIFPGKATPQNLVLAKEYVLEAMQWLITDQIAENVEVECEYQNLSTLAIAIRLIRPRGNIQTFKYDYVWNQI